MTATTSERRSTDRGPTVQLSVNVADLDRIAQALDADLDLNSRSTTGEHAQLAAWVNLRLAVAQHTKANHPS